MLGMEAAWDPYSLVALQLLGLVAAWTTRLSEGSRYQTACQLWFLAYLALIGGATIVSGIVARGAWLGFAATFSIMVVMAASDFRYPSRVEA
jgi:hypothetical protein